MDTHAKHGLFLRFCVVLLASIAPLIFWLYREDQVSISEFWGTSLTPLFIFTNAATSYFFFSLEKWKPSAVFLLLLTAFSVEDFFVLHNIFAASFFLYNFIPLATDKRLYYYIAPYVLSLAFVEIPDIFFSECLAIFTLCTYHAHRILLIWHITKSRRRIN